LTSSFELDATLRKIKPEKRRRKLTRRADAHLTFVDRIDPGDGPFLLDTCVYLDGGKRQLPRDMGRLLVAPGQVFHSAVSVAELSSGLGRLDPVDPRTRRNLPFLRETLARIRDDRTLAPDAATYAACGVLVGTLARTQSLGDTERRRLLPDGLIFLTARKFGLRLLTANVHDFDLMHQIVSDAKIAYYRPVTRP
jgi:predicted nucleic acid-binding protein